MNDKKLVMNEEMFALRPLRIKIVLINPVIGQLNAADLVEFGVQKQTNTNNKKLKLIIFIYKNSV